MSGRRAGAAIAIALGLALAGCSPHVERPGPALGEPFFFEDRFVAADGAITDLRRWLPDGPPTAALVALHGFNDYGNFLADAGAYLAARGIAVYAYDQRGFGRSFGRGLWHGGQVLADDLAAVVRVVRRRHPDLPLHVLGESMGGAVAMVAMTGPRPPAVDGVILAAPAVWGRATMPFYQRAALALAAHAVPWLKVSGRGLGIRPSDNIEMLRALGRDPLVIKETRIDALHGLADLMDAALAAAPAFDVPALFLYGERDEVIPAPPVRRMIQSLPPAGEDRRRIAYYRQGYHMLLRDLAAETVWADIAAWIADRRRPLPSGADRPARALVDPEPTADRREAGDAR